MHAAWVLRLALLATGCATTLAQLDTRIPLDVRLNDRSFRFIFDTGASVPFIVWESVPADLGVSIRPLPADASVRPGQVAVRYSEPVKVEMFGQVIPDIELAVASSSNLPMDIHGAVGWPALRRNFLVFRGREFAIAQALPKETLKLAPLAVVPDSGTLALKLPKSVGDKPAYAGIDTGSSHGLHLSSEEWTRWRSRHPRAAVTLNAYFTPGVGLVVTEEGWAEEIDLAGLKLHGVAVARMNQAETQGYPAGTRAVFGLHGLRRMDLFIDGAKDTAYVRPVRSPGEPYPHNRLGAVFMPPTLEEDDLRAHVAAGSPAARAGLKTNDVLLKIDDLDVTHWRTEPSILPLGRFWEQPPGTRIHLTLRRGEQTVAIDVVLANIIGPAPTTAEAGQR
jgi:hypothetical protein